MHLQVMSKKFVANILVCKLLVKSLLFNVANLSDGGDVVNGQVGWAETKAEAVG